jgi:MinD-like ATPase involved in chromosome partitioning or flagellar assembly
VTTLTCALGAVWPAERQVLLAECDPSGGDLALRFGLNTRRGMASLVLAQRQGPAQDPSFDSHTQCLPGGLEVLPGPVGADSAIALDHEIAKAAGTVLPRERDSLVDCGRLGPAAPGQRRILEESDAVVLVARPEASALGNARWALERLKDLERAEHTSMVLVGRGQFSISEVSGALGVEIIEIVPDDPGGAAVACGVPGKARAFARSPLLASARRIVQRILCEVSIANSNVVTLTDGLVENEVIQAPSELTNAGTQ